ncbi:MAG: chemotaxis response regulator protein-glutamate methylesterase [Candidatus Omnitrophica bacterium]|nr:chemotaxis response regulator protein-glutamate methylesterase [Candidatus Omnitrophota bacterium]
MSGKVRVLVVDDSALARRMLSDMLQQNPGIDVVGAAQDGSFVINKIKTLQPDVITLDVEMRTKGGLEVLPEIVQNYRIPVIMVSAQTKRGAQATLKALELGALDFVTKPQAGDMRSFMEIGDVLAQKILAVSRSARRLPLRRVPPPASTRPPSILRRPLASSSPSRVDVIALGASTGGTEAIKQVLMQLPEQIPGIVIVQHMPAGFTQAFAQRLDSLCRIAVKEAEEGDEILPGRALIAPGSHHMEVVRVGVKRKVRLLDTPPVNRHRPSVDVLFFSVAEQIGRRAMGVLLTGMGADGADGMRFLKDQGAFTVAQDEETCVVFGMPKEAVKRDGVCQLLPLQQIPGILVNATLSSPGLSKMA